MQCAKCKTELPPNAKFCLECGTAVPAGPGVQVQQDIDTVKGSVTGAVVGNGTQSAGLNIEASQKIKTVENGGAVVGVILGDKRPIHVGGQQHYGDDVQGNKHEVHTEGGAYVEGSVNTGGGNFIGRDADVPDKKAPTQKTEQNKNKAE